MAQHQLWTYKHCPWQLTSWQNVDHVVQPQRGQLKGPLIALAQYIEQTVATPHRLAGLVANVASQDLQCSK